MHESMPLLCSFDLDQCCLIVEISLITFRKAKCVLSVKLLYVITVFFGCAYYLKSVGPSVAIILI